MCRTNKYSGLFAVAGVLLLAKGATAQPEYPGAVKSHFAMKCAPTCSLCHIDPNGGGPRNTWGNARGILATVPTAVTVLGMQMPPDFDGDGISDVDELKQARNPGIFGEASVCGPEYGISCKVGRAASAPPREASFALLAAGAALLLRRRARSSFFCRAQKPLC